SARRGREPERDRQDGGEDDRQVRPLVVGSEALGVSGRAGLAAPPHDGRGHDSVSSSAPGTPASLPPSSAPSRMLPDVRRYGLIATRAGMRWRIASEPM